MRQSISELLCRIALDAPHLIVYPAVVGSTSRIQVKLPGQKGLFLIFLIWLLYIRFFLWSPFFLPLSNFHRVKIESLTTIRAARQAPKGAKAPFVPREKLAPIDRQRGAINSPRHLAEFIGLFYWQLLLNCWQFLLLSHWQFLLC